MPFSRAVAEREAERFARGLKQKNFPLVLVPVGLWLRLQRVGTLDSVRGLRVGEKRKSSKWVSSLCSAISPTSLVQLECICSLVKINVSSEYMVMGHW